MNAHKSGPGLPPAGPQPPLASAARSCDSIDATVIAQLRKDYGDEDGSLLVDLIGAFEDEARVFLKVEAVAQPASTAKSPLAQAAHRLKSAAGTLGARKLVGFCQQLEAAERTRDTAQSSDVRIALEACLGRVRSALARFAAAIKASGAA
jgi:HPt (histidine-containing phosphotransfer) domain-containing protein